MGLETLPLLHILYVKSIRSDYSLLLQYLIQYAF